MNQPGPPYTQQPWAQAQNPHAAPGPAMYRQNLFVPYGASAGPVVGPTLRKVKLAVGIAQVLALVVAMILLIIAGVTSHDPDASPAPYIMGFGFFGLWYLLLFGYAIVNMMWLYQFWSWIPPEQRYTTMWKKYISPGTAIGFMFIPYFNVYWLFVVYLGIADIMERMRVQYPSRMGSAKTLAIMTCVVPLVFFPAAPFLQFFFAKHVEDMAREMQARMSGVPGAM